MLGIFCKGDSFDTRLAPRPSKYSQRDIVFVLLSSYLLQEYLCTNDDDFLTKSLQLGRVALALCAHGHPRRAEALNAVSSSLLASYQSSKDASCLPFILQYSYEVLDLSIPNHPTHSTALNSVALATYEQYLHLNEPALLDKALSSAQRALDLRPCGVPLRDESLHTLGNLYMGYWEIFSDTTSLDRAGRLLREAVELRTPGHPKLGDSMGRLATCLSVQFEIYGNISLLDECISIARKVLDLRPHGHPLRDCSMNNLSNYLRDRHYHLGDIKALKERQHLVIKALELCPPGHPRRGRRLHALGIDLHEKYTRSGDVALLDEAASVLQESTTLAVTAAPYNRSLTLSVLGNILRCRYQHLGDVTSLDRSCEVFAEALSLCPPGHYGRNFHLANYATVLRTQFTQSGDITALDCATKYLEEALELCPAGHQLRESTVKLFASVLCDRYLLTGDVVALNTAIDYFRESLVLRPPGRDIRPEALTDLASALYQSYQANGNPELIDEAIELYIEAIESRQTEHNVRHTALISLALLYLNPSCFRHDTHLAFEYLLNMVKHTDGSPRSRLIAARKFLGHAQELYYSGQIRSQGDMKLQNLILTVYQETVALLPVVANFSLDLSSRLRESALSQILGCAGATFALECGQKAIALEILEEARSIFWCQGLRLRDTQFNDLPIELAIQLEELFKALSQWPETPLQSEISTSYHNEDHAFRRRQNETVHQLLQDVRKLRGFERFLLGQQFSSLTQAACKGPVVVLISDQFRCNALILLNKNGETRHVPLSLLTPHSLKGLSVRSRALHTTRGNERSILSDSVGRAVRIRRKGKWEDGEHILEELWMKVVKPIINALGLQKAEGRARPRIHWCPAGDFAHVPLHAAGLYRHNDQQTTESCSDFVVSSYTPTLTALINARRNREAVASNSLKALLIGEGAAPGFTQIPCSIEEIKMVHDILHERSPTMKISVEGLDSEKGAQIQPVLTELQEAAIVHFACHGQQHPDPLESSFRLRDGPLTLSALMRLKLPKAYFAFLSACETAQGDISLQDQPIHLAAAMLFTGFKSVIASMWAMHDQDGPRIARVVYEELLRSDSLNDDDIPYALDAAVKKLREEGNVPSRRWATFIHVGS